MKRYVLLSALMTSGAASGTAEKVPPDLVGATHITTTIKGKRYRFKANDFMIVDREKSRKYHAMRNRIIADLRRDLLNCQRKLAKVSKSGSSRSKKSRYRNTITLHGGIGPSGLKDKRVDGGTIIEPDQAIIGGVSYSRRIFSRVRLGASFFSSQNPSSAALLGGAGYEF